MTKTFTSRMGRVAEIAAEHIKDRRAGQGDGRGFSTESLPPHWLTERPVRSGRSREIADLIDTGGPHDAWKAMVVTLVGLERQRFGPVAPDVVESIVRDAYYAEGDTLGYVTSKAMAVNPIPTGMMVLTEHGRDVEHPTFGFDVKPKIYR